MAAGAPALASDTVVPFQGPNCSLEAPPDTAGEEVRDGEVNRIHPRRRDLAKDYTGCQLVFAPRGDAWSVAESVYLERGVVLRSSYAAVPGQSAGECRFEDGRLAQGDRRACPSPRQIPFRSLPPGCFAEVRDNGVIADWCRLE